MESQAIVLATSRARLASATVDEAFGQSEALISECGFADRLAV